MKVLLFCAIFCISFRVSTLQPIDKRQIEDDQLLKALVLAQPNDAKPGDAKTVTVKRFIYMPLCPPGLIYRNRTYCLKGIYNPEVSSEDLEISRRGE